MNNILEFAKWIGEKQYTKHQCNDRWYDDGNYIGSTKDLFNVYLLDKEWQESKINRKHNALEN